MGVGRIDPNGQAGAEARNDASRDRRGRLAAMAQRPWRSFLLRLLVQIVVIIAVAAVLFWVLSRLRGY